MPLTEALKDRARALGFCAVGVTGAEPFVEAESAATTRTAEGLMDGLTWWSPMRAHASADPRRALPDAGSYVLLAEIVTSAALQPDQPLKKSCGTCDACMRVCPTGALVKPGVLDNQRCISFWTIEHRGVIPRDIRPLIGDWIFGCDLCQEICPVNARPAAPDAAALTAFGPMMEPRPRLDELLTLDDESFRARFRQSAVWRTRRSGLLRNVCIALGNVADRRSVPALAAALADDQPLIRGHAAWALGRLGGAAARNALALALRREADSWVRDECQLAIEECGPLAVPSAGVPPSPLPPAPA